MRLAFSVAVNVDPDILIIDEVLGVGDQAFFKKCFDRIMEFRRAGKTILCVSHSLPTLEQLCNRAVWLDHGRVLQTGSVSQVIRAYTASMGFPVPRDSLVLYVMYLTFSLSSRCHRVPRRDIGLNPPICFAPRHFRISEVAAATRRNIS